MNKVHFNSFSWSAIFFGIITALAAIGFAGLLALVLLTTLLSLPLNDLFASAPVLVGLGTSLGAIAMYFISAYIAALVSDAERALFNSIGSWAMLTIFISFLSFTAIMTINFTGAGVPVYFVTDIQVTKLKAVTSVQISKNDKKMEKAEHTPQTRRMLWLTFVSLLLGLGASYGGGRLAARHHGLYKR